MPSTDKTELISKNPVTCARYFEYRFRQLFYKVICNNQGPFKDHNVVDYYWRVEFQHGGSPHVHMVTWLKDTPKFSSDIKSNFKEIIKFIDKYITCKNRADYGEKEEFYGFQFHKHSKRKCRIKDRGGNLICKYNFPKPILQETMILEPLSDEDTSLTHYYLLYLQIRACLDEIHKEKRVISYEDFLVAIDVTESDYIKSIRASINKTTVFLKRTSRDIMVNNYNKDILSCHRANMDIQFILDPYACVRYIVNYINKGNRALSKLIRDTVEEVESGNLNIRKKLSSIASTLKLSIIY
jgi:hypothetical protein